MKSKTTSPTHKPNPHHTSSVNNTLDTRETFHPSTWVSIPKAGSLTQACVTKLLFAVATLAANSKVCLQACTPKWFKVLDTDILTLNRPVHR